MNLNTPSQQNGNPIHWYENNGTPCHAAVIAGNAMTVDGYPTTADILQLDHASGVLRRNAVQYDDTMVDGVMVPADDTWHGVGCMRAPTVIEVP